MSETFPPLTGYGWNGARYFDLETGRFVSNAAIRDGLEQMMDVSALRMNALTQQLIDGGISLADWQTGMMQQIKIAHTASAALSQGGWAQMNQSDWGATGQLIRTQYSYLRNFAAEIESGKQPLDGRALVRSDMYADAANGTYEEMNRRSAIGDGMDEEMRELEAKDGNNCDGCLDQAALGWQPIGTLDPIGAEECGTRCRCTFKFRNSVTGEET